MPVFSESTYLQALGWAIINSFWQMSLLWILYKAIIAFNPQNANRRGFLATLLLSSGFIWFLFTWISSLNGIPENTLIGSAVYVFNTENDIYPILTGMAPVAAILYLLFLLLPLRQFIRNYRYVRIVKNAGLQKIHIDWRIFVGKMSVRMGIKRNVKIWLSEFVNSPVTIGFIKPVILIPVAAINNLSTQQLESILLHEIAHIRRKDYLINFLLTIIHCLLYFNPFVKLLLRVVEEERELSCDEFVLQFQYNAREYASALLTLEKISAPPYLPMAIAATGKPYGLLKRIERILGVQGKKSFTSLRNLAGISFSLFFVLICNCFLISGNFSIPNTGESFFSFNDLAVTHFSPISTETGLQKVNTTKALSPGAQASPTAKSKENDVSVKQVDQEDQAYKNRASMAPSPPQIIPVGFVNPVAPALTKQDEAQVEATLDATKKIIAATEWKELQKNFAEALSSAEKVQLKAAFEKQISEKDWSELRDRLRYEFANIDWEKAQTKLGNAIIEIRIDSVINECKKTIQQLSTVEGLMEQYKVASIPDTDLSLQALKEEQQKAKKQLEKIIAIRERKIIRL
ncbi:MAG: hypothetical protein GC171_07760 [Terrimonas sp.]|nr:hypothetical protein [Terrimonas sp.]